MGGLAGCSGLTDQSFEATPVILPDSARDEFVLAETGRNSETTTREGPSGNIEVEITNHASVYRRDPARETPTVLEMFVGGVNQTPGSGSSVNVVASDLGIDQASLGPLEGTPSVAGDEFTLLIPEGARNGGELQHGKLMALVPGAAMEPDSVTYDGDGPGAFFPEDAFQVFVPNVDEVFIQTPVVGIEDLPEGAERVESGETIQTNDMLYAARLADFENPHVIMPAEEVFDQAVMLPLGGQPYGLGALSTPDASVAGQSANPLVGMDTAELLQQDAARRVLAETGVTDADTVEWLAGPERHPLADYPIPHWTTLLGTETDLEAFGGVLSGENGLWGTLLFVGRITDVDYVVAVSAMTRPVGTVDGGMALVEGSGWGMNQGSELLPQAAEFTADVVGELQRGN